MYVANGHRRHSGGDSLSAVETGAVKLKSRRLHCTMDSMSRYINPYTDFGFKRLFGEEANKDLLIDFLNTLEFIFLQMPLFKKTESELETHVTSIRTPILVSSVCSAKKRIRTC